MLQWLRKEGRGSDGAHYLESRLRAPLAVSETERNSRISEIGRLSDHTHQLLARARVARAVHKRREEGERWTIYSCTKRAAERDRVLREE